MGKLLFCLFALGILPSIADGSPAVRELFDGKTLNGWYKYLRGHGRDGDPKNVISVTNGVIRITGEEFGALVTEEEFSDYRLDVEYRWNGPAYGFKRKWAPDSGVLFHSTGPDGAFDGVWMHSLECNLIKGASGDFWTVGATNRPDIFIEGEAIPGVRLDCGYGKFPIWKEGGEKVHLSGNNRLCRCDIARNWRDKPDVEIAVNEKPMGEWNALSLVCRGETATVYFNGKLVNKATRVSPAHGKIQLQSEGWGVEFRKATLTKLNGRTD